MKNIITILILFAFVGCRESENGAYKYRKSAKTEVSNQEDSVVGTYKIRKQHPIKPDSDTFQHMMVRKDGVSETYWVVDGKELAFGGGIRDIANWKVKDDEMIVTEQTTISRSLGYRTFVHRFEKDGSLTTVATGWTKDGKFEREDYALKYFQAWEKIK